MPLRRSRPTWTSRRWSARARSGAPRRCIPATASCPRTRRWPGPARRPGSPFIGPPPEAGELMGDKLRAKEAAAARRGPGGPQLQPRTRRATGGRRRVSPAGQGGRRRRRARHARRASAPRTSTPRWSRAPRGQGRLRRRPRVHRALPAAGAPHRGAGDRRRPRQRASTSASASARCSAATRR